MAVSAGFGMTLQTCISIGKIGITLYWYWYRLESSERIGNRYCQKLIGSTLA